ncbi:hypothetical protein HK103_004490 [Boothiomyces macroporosus]|uniref:T-cell immunomodulatory protein TIP C2 domain-containing protein n=1 Tax=Boothiomyces macroporosus TaxID=261099 RepID=A0AAD5UGL6_9FUNG|nr:hypothetical protein HK103_004490 [Boothiomyces macroporosus]
MTRSLQPSILVSENDKLVMWNYNGTFYKEVLNGFCKVSDPHSNGFVDMDGDCMADLFLTCMKDDKLGIEVYITPEFELKYQTNLPENAGQILFGDFDADGTIDILFPICNTECFINVLYNIQLPICQDDSLNCRQLTDLCTPSPFSFDPKSGGNYVTSPLNNIIPDYRLLSIKLGDYNNDGFPDLLVVVSSKYDKYRKYIRLLESVECDFTCGTRAMQKRRRTFKLVTTGVDQLYSIDSVIHGAMMDMNNDGSLDVFVSYKPDGQTKTSVFINNIYKDALFFKPLVLNSLCLTCDTTKPYGVNYAGASFKHTVIDTNGKVRVTQSCQLPQQAYMSLQVANNVIGLGRTNNYIDNLFVGVSRNENVHYRSYQGLIPNSGIVIGPYEENHEGPEEWKLELYMNPSSTTNAIIIVLSSVCIILGAIIFGLDLSERRQDYIEKREQLENIDFEY